MNNSKGVFCCCGARYNRIYNNNFKQNTFYNAEEQSNLNNYWNEYPFGGNYWDDYTGVDENNDGFGDTPYYITGSVNNDDYPLMKPINMVNCTQENN